MLRKQSSPMMPPFMVSAPGKVIVYGEHAVVHGKVEASRLRIQTIA
jgi:mevalonate kinase